MNIKRKGLTVGALLLCMNLSTFAQSIKLNLKGVSVERAMTELREKSGYSFVFAASDVNTHKVINVNAKDLKQAIGQILDGQNVSYQIKGKNIVVYKGVKAQNKSNGQQNGKQKKRVNGTIVDEAGMPVIGAAVRQRGTQNATVTDIDGNFTLDATEGADLEVTYIGYEPKSVRVGESDNYKLAMKPASRELNEVVVTALGIKRAEKALSYNVQQVKSDELTRVKDANFVNSLNGKIAGVTINKSGSGVGGSTRVVMRGAKSLEGNNNALYVVDGIPLFNNSMGSDSGIMGEGKAGTEGIADFNPEDIESISVLSGPSAAALYGSSAANGVILINTKKGKEGKLQVTFSSSSEFSKAYMTPEFQNTYGNKRDVYESWGDKLDVPSSYDPKKDFFNTGTNFINSVTLTTGNKTNQTFASISSTNSAGIVPNNEYNRLNITIRNSSSFLNDKLQLDLGASFVKQDDKNMVSQGQYWNPVMAAYLFPRGENFNEMKVFERWDESRRIPVQYWPVSEPTYASQNPYWTAYRNVATNDKRRYMFNFGLTYKIAPWINVAARYRLDDSFVKFQRKIYATSDQKFAEGPKGHYGYSNYNDHQDYADVMANINKNFADFSLSANIGWSYSNYWNERDVKVVDGMRSPLTYRSEHVKMKLVRNSRIDYWYRYMYTGVVLNYHGHDVMCFGGADFDYDILATTDCPEVVNGIYPNELPVYYEPPKPAKIVPTKEDLFKSDTFSFGSIIGSITNKGSSGYALLSDIEYMYGKNSIEYVTTLNRLKMSCKLQSAQID